MTILCCSYDYTAPENVYSSQHCLSTVAFTKPNITVDERAPNVWKRPQPALQPPGSLFDGEKPMAMQLCLPHCSFHLPGYCMTS